MLSGFRAGVERGRGSAGSTGETDSSESTDSTASDTQTS